MFSLCYISFLSLCDFTAIFHLFHFCLSAISPLYFIFHFSLSLLFHFSSIRSYVYPHLFFSSVRSAPFDQVRKCAFVFHPFDYVYPHLFFSSVRSAPFDQVRKCACAFVFHPFDHMSPHICFMYVVDICVHICFSSKSKCATQVRLDAFWG